MVGSLALTVTEYLDLRLEVRRRSGEIEGAAANANDLRPPATGFSVSLPSASSVTTTSATLMPVPTVHILVDRGHRISERQRGWCLVDVIDGEREGRRGLDRPPGAGSSAVDGHRVRGPRLEIRRRTYVEEGAAEEREEGWRPRPSGVSASLPSASSATAIRRP